MFLNAHERLNIPASAAEVIRFGIGGKEFPGLRVPNVLAFHNDSLLDVTLNFDATDDRVWVESPNAQGAGGYDCTDETTDKIKFAIDGETAITVDLGTYGNNATAAEVATGINAALVAAGGKTALARAIVTGADATAKVRIISGSIGSESKIEIMTPAAHANTGLGFVVGVYTEAWTSAIIAQKVVKAGGLLTVENPRPGSSAIRIRGSASAAVVIDCTLLYSHTGVQQ